MTRAWSKEKLPAGKTDSASNTTVLDQWYAGIKTRFNQVDGPASPCALCVCQV